MSTRNLFDVAGAGKVLIDTNLTITGGACGIAFDVSWSRYGMSGGVMDHAEVIRLRNVLDAWLVDIETQGGIDTLRESLRLRLNLS